MAHAPASVNASRTPCGGSVRGLWRDGV